MKILGIDTSLRSTGFGVMELSGTRMQAVEFGNIKISSKEPLSGCLKKIYEKIDSLCEIHNPDVVAIEEVIYAKNALTTLVLGEARGAVIAAVSRRGIPIFEYEPRRMKRAVTGNGMAEKMQIQLMVKTLLSLAELPQNDAADALGLAICHAHSRSVLSSNSMPL